MLTMLCLRCCAVNAPFEVNKSVCCQIRKIIARKQLQTSAIAVLQHSSNFTNWKIGGQQDRKIEKGISFQHAYYSGKSNTLEEVVQVKFVRSSGPGGQNVNKLNTKAEIRFNVGKANWMGEEVRKKLLEQQKNRMNKNGELIVTSDKYRTQSRNLKDAISKLKELIHVASYVPEGPSKDTLDKILERIERENEKRLEGKKFRSEKKKNRIVS